MKKYSLLLVILLSLSGLICAQKAKNGNGYSDMIKSEYAFAEKAAEAGTRDAFLSFIDDEGILFRPGPVNGKKFLTDSQKRPGLLSWFPVYAKISKAGDLGFTTGPWEFKMKAEDSAASYYGNFCTVWKRQNEGNWKFLIDFGNSNDKPGSNLIPLSVDEQLISMGDAVKAETDLKIEILYKLDKQLSLQNLDKYLSVETRFLRDGFFPLNGSKGINNYISKEEMISFLSIPEGGHISASGDLGYTYGILESGSKSDTGKRFYYMRIWKKSGNGAWEIAVDVASEKK